MRLQPFVSADGVAFDTTPAQLAARFGPPLRRERNAVALNAWDYGHTVFRFQDHGRLEEITSRSPVLHLGDVAVPFAALGGFVRSQDAGCFERAGFVVSPRFGLAFAPADPDWVTALARHCLDSWRAL